MANLAVQLLVLVVLCQSIAVFGRQVSLDNGDWQWQYADETANLQRQERQSEQQQGQEAQQAQQRQNGAGSTTTTTTPSPQFTNCVAACQTTSQYNPVCGTDGQSYRSPDRLRCAQRCGLSVDVAHIGTCGPAGGK